MRQRDGAEHALGRLIGDKHSSRQGLLRLHRAAQEDNPRHRPPVIAESRKAVFQRQHEITGDRREAYDERSDTND